MAQHLETHITVKLLRDLNSDIEKASQRMKVFPMGRQWSTMFPSVVWCNNRWHTITRLIDTGGQGWIKSNHLITQTFDEKFEPTSSPRLLGLPTYLNGVICAGLEDPRLILHDGRLLIQGNVHYPDPTSHEDVCRIGVFDAGTSTGALLDVPGFKLYRWEKSWTGFIKDGSVHYLYSLAPLVELKCDITSGICEVVYHQDLCQTPPCAGVPPHGNETWANFLRGGTSMIPWNTSTVPGDLGYYIGFAHTNIGGNVWKEAMEGLEFHPLAEDIIGFHKTHLFVYSAKEHRIVYVSSPIVLGPETLRKLGARWNGFVQDPSSFVLTPEGRFVLGINLDDSHSVIAAVEGLVPVIEAAIKMDREQQQPQQQAAAGGAAGAHSSGPVPAGGGAEDDPNLLGCVLRGVKKYLRNVSVWR